MPYNDPSLLQQWEQTFVQFLQGRESDDASHDISHFQRVWRTASKLLDNGDLSANRLVILAACYFHDIVVLPKNHPQRSMASTLAAEETERCLTVLSFPQALINDVCHAVKTHSYSAGITPETIEAKVVQDADRMEALGAIGLARCFYTGGKLKQKLFDPEDPLATHRELDDRIYSLDHFELKLLKIAGSMQTAAGRQMAERSSQFLKDFRDQLCRELNGEY
ncbi:hydrolase [Endozoicomonas montiporae]|uniref:Hydrolase n=2 Tax=Endozoicomonas montiporae TaxID=1027273 RepID=A0A081N251_9GAMM|nr:phosphohydrolase [Endozoicomonas montiporae]AMO58520.1 hydrolase [Endozoicomonas montiporae CL-33]KEQ12524.1 hydrolase [Endozoicomonas montiporae]